MSRVERLHLAIVKFMTGQIISMLISVAFIPAIVSRIDAENITYLSIFWILFGSLGYGDTVLSKSVIRYGIDGPGAIQDNYFSALIFKLIFGFLLGILVIFISILLHLIGVLSDEIRQLIFPFSIAILGLALWVGLRGILEGEGRFLLLSLIRIWMAFCVIILPFIGISWGFSFKNVLTFSIIASVSCVFLVSMSVFLPKLFYNHYDVTAGFVTHAVSLFQLNFWVGLMGIVGSIIVYIDRLPIMKFDYHNFDEYAVIYEIVNRPTLLLSGMSSVLIPIFAQLKAENKHQEAKKVCINYQIKTLLIAILISISLVIYLIGSRSHIYGKSNLQIVVFALAIGGVFSAVAQIPLGALLIYRNPRNVVLNQIIILIIYLMLALIFVINYGIVGGAIAWLLRSMIGVIYYNLLFLRTPSCEAQP